MSKIKHERTADCVVAGYRVHKSGRGRDRVAAARPLRRPRRAGVGRRRSARSRWRRRRELFAELQPLVTTFDGHPWDWAAHGAGRADPAQGRGQPVERRQGPVVRPAAAGAGGRGPLRLHGGRRFRHTAQFVRWRPDREPGVVHVRAARAAGRVRPRRRAHQRLTAPPRLSHAGSCGRPAALAHRITGWHQGRDLCTSPGTVCERVGDVPRPTRAETGGRPGAHRARRAARAGRPAARGAVLRDQSRPGHRRHRPPLRPAGEPVLAGAARGRVHAAPAAARASRGSCPRSGSGSRTWRAGDRRADELTDDELGAGGVRLRELALGVRPRWLAVVGITAYRVAFDAPRAAVGPQQARSATRASGCCPTPAA